MARCTDTEAESRFVALDSQLPVVVDEVVQPDAVSLSCSDCQPLCASAALGTRRNEFKELYAEWLALQNRQVEEHALWNDDLRVW